jgi:hypothetical protein
MFKMGTRAAVECRLGPVVAKHFYPLGAHIHHWFYGDDETWLDMEIAAAAKRTTEEVWDLRLFVHLAADAMTDEALDCGKPIIADVLCHFASDLAPTCFGMHELECEVERTFGYVQQFLHAGCDAACRVGNCGIATPTVHATTGVDAYYVAFHERALCWNAMDDFFIDACAGGRREGGQALVLVGIVFEQRFGAAVAKVFGDDGIDLGCRNARRDDLSDQLVRLPDANAGLAHERDFAF